MAFKIKDFTSTNSQDESSEDTSPLGMVLQSLIGDDLTQQFFGPGGPVQGLTANGKITLNGESVDVAIVQSLFATGIASKDKNGNETYRSIEVISVEVSE